MLRLIAYDIADPKRLRRIAEACEDYGVRVQKSLFECWLEEPRFEQLWARLQTEIKAEEDALPCAQLPKIAGQFAGKFRPDLYPRGTPANLTMQRE